MSTLRQNLDVIFQKYGIEGDEDAIVKILVENDSVTEMLLALYDKTFQEMGGSSWGLEAKQDRASEQSFVEVRILINPSSRDSLLEWWIKESEKVRGCLLLSISLYRVKEPVEFLSEEQFDATFSYSTGRSYTLGRNAVLDHLRRNPYLINPLIEIEREASTFFDNYLVSQLQLHSDPECGGPDDLWLEIFTRRAEPVPTGEAFSSYWEQREDCREVFYNKIDYYDSSYPVVMRMNLSVNLEDISQSDDLDKEKERTERWWSKNQDWLLENYQGQFALVYSGVYLRLFPSLSEAYSIGKSLLDSDLFSVVEINEDGTTCFYGDDTNTKGD